MKLICRIGLVPIGVCIFSCCLATTSAFRPDVLSPKWTRQLSDENSTDIPKRVIQLQNRLLYPTRSFFHNMFSAQYQIDKSRILQVWIKRHFRFETFVIVWVLICRNPRDRYRNRPSSIAIPTAPDRLRGRQAYMN